MHRGTSAEYAPSPSAVFLAALRARRPPHQFQYIYRYIHISIYIHIHYLYTRAKASAYYGPSAAVLLLDPSLCIHIT